VSHAGRRNFLAATGALLAAPYARAQLSSRPLVLGALYLGRKPTPEELAKRPLIVKLKSLGWAEGQNLVVENAYAEGKDDRLPELAAELVRRRVDVIYAFGPDAAVAAAQATNTIPIVFWGVPYPVEQGLINSFARPGGNVTGATQQPADPTGFFTKQLQLMKEIAPSITRVAAIRSPTTFRSVAHGQLEVTEKQKSTIESAARSLKVDLKRYNVAKGEDFDAVFAAILAFKAQGLSVAGSPLTLTARPRIVDFANSNRLVSSLLDKTWVQAGGLFSYGADPLATVGQAAVCIDKILRGARPADIAVEMPSKFELVINLKTAKAIGITIPQSVLARADELIQ
jgi:putative ABC transport system substrate-binding protein